MKASYINKNLFMNNKTNNNPFSLVAGAGLGVSHSSLSSAGSLLSAQPFGQAGLHCSVNMATGNLFCADHELSFSDTGNMIEFCLVYNSLAATPWRLAYGRSITNVVANKSLTVVEVDGHEVEYLYEPNQKCYRATSYQDGQPIVRVQDGQFIWKHPKTFITETFSATGSLLKRTDLSNNLTQFEYTDQQELKTIIAPSGARYEFERVQKDNQTIMTVFLNENNVKTLLHTYAFDAQKLLCNSKTPDGYEIVYDYHAANGLKSIVQSDTSTFSFNYTANQLTTLQVGNNAANTHRFAYHANTNSAKHIDPSGVVSQLAYDSSQRADFFVNGKAAETTKFTYHASGQLKHIQYPDLGQETFAYEPNHGLLSAHTQRDGVTTNYAYRATDRPLLETETAIGVADTTPRSTYHVYDAADHLAYQISPAGRVKNYLVANNGLVQSELEFLQHTCKVTQVPTLDAMTKWRANAQSGEIALTSYDHDTHGRVKEINQRSGHGLEKNSKTTLKYDCFDHVVQREEQIEELQVFKTAKTIDSLSRVLAETIGAGTAQAQQTTQTFVGNMCTKILPNGRVDSTILNTDGTVQSKISTSQQSSYSENYSYDPVKRIKMMILQPDGRKELYFYDEQQRLSAKVSATGRVITYAYDVAKRYMTKTAYAKAIDPKKIYDQVQNNQDSKILLALLNAAIQSTPQEDRATFTSLDAYDRIHFRIDAEGYLTEYRYDDHGKQNHVILYAAKITAAECELLKAGTMLSRVPDRKVDRVQSTFRDQDGLIVATQGPDGYVTQLLNDAGGRVKERIQHATTKLTLSNDVTQIIPNSDTKNDAHTWYFYNLLGQCELEVDAEGHITEYAYYPDGKRKQVTYYAEKIANEWLQSADKSRPEKIILSSNDRTTTYAYDALRRTLTETTAHGLVTTYAYNDLNLQTAAYVRDQKQKIKTNGDCLRGQEARYDAWGREIAHLNPLAVEKLAEIDLKLMQQQITEAQAHTEKKAIWSRYADTKQFDASGLKLSSKDAAGNTTVFYYDLDHRPILAINLTTGAVVEHTYNAFGEVLVECAYYQAIAVEKRAELVGGYVTDAVRQLIVANADKDVCTVYERNLRGGIQQKTSPEGFVSLFDYNAFQECQREKHQVDKDGRTCIIEHEYGQHGHETSTKKLADGLVPVLSSRHYDHYTGTETSYKDSTGVCISTTPDRLGRMVEKKQLSEDLQWVSLEKRELDTFGRVIKTTDALGHSTKTTYQDAEKRAEITYADGTKTNIKQNVFGETIHTTNALSHAISCTYAPTGAVATRTNVALNATTIAQYEVDGLLHQEIDAAGTVTAHTYENNLLQTTTVDANGLKQNTVLERNALQQIEKTIDPRNIATTFAYDRDGGLTETIRDPEKLALTTRHKNNAAGLPIVESKGDASTRIDTLIKRDAYGRKTETIIDPTTATNPNAPAVTEKTTYARQGRNIITIDAYGYKKQEFHDVFDRKRFCFEQIDAESGRLLAWEYDATGQLSATRVYQTSCLLSAINGETSIADLMKHKQTAEDAYTRYFRDELGRERFKINCYVDADTQEQLGLVEETQYDAAGNTILIARHFLPISTVTLALYTTADVQDVMTDMESLQHPQTQVTRQFHDAAGRVRFSIDPAGCIIEKQYDKVGHEIASIEYRCMTLPVAQLAALSEANLTKTLHAYTIDPKRDAIHYYLYDAVGNCTHVINPEGGVIRKAYDANNNLVGKTTFRKPVEMSLDYASMVKQVQALVPNVKDANLKEHEKDSVETMVLDNADRLETKTDAKGYKDIYQHDAFGNVISHTDRRNQTWKYHYDHAQELTDKYAPESKVTFVTGNVANGLQAATKRVSVVEHTELDRSQNRTTVTEGHGHDGYARTATVVRDGLQRIIRTEVPNVAIDDADKQASLTDLPEKIITASESLVYDNKGNVLVAKDADDRLQFNIYDTLGRIIYKVNTRGVVVQTTYNTLNQVESTTQYAYWVEFDKKLYADKGLPADVLAAMIRKDAIDRITTFKYDAAGHVQEIQQGEVFYYSNEECGLGKPTVQQFFDAAGNCILERILIRKNTWAETRKWYDRNNQEIAVLSPDLYLTLTKRDPFGHEVRRVEYAEALKEVPAANLNAVELEELVTKTPGKDRSFRYERDERFDVVREVLENVVCRETFTNEQGLPDLRDLPAQDLARTTEYDAGQLPICTTNEMGNKAYHFYDERGIKNGESQVARTRYEDDTVLTPVTTYGIDLFGKRVRTTRHAVSPDKIDASACPVLSVHEDDQIELKLFDVRGLNKCTDQNGQTTAYTYTTTKQTARKFYEEVIFEGSGGAYIEKKCLDEFNYGYDAAHVQDSLIIRRDGGVVSELYKIINAFGQTVSEGTSKLNTPSYTCIDTSGRTWSSNAVDGGHFIQWHDLSGAETLKLEAPEFNLSNVRYEGLQELLKMDKDSLWRTELKHRKDGKLITVIPPHLWGENKVLRTYELDHWGNATKETDSSGYVTERIFNHVDHVTCLIQPETSATDESGKTTRAKPVTLFGYNACQAAIGEKDPAGHVTASILNEANEGVMTILGDGTVEERVKLDIFGRPDEIISAIGGRTKRKFDQHNNTLEQTFPSGKQQSYVYNKIGCRRQVTYFVGQTTSIYRMNFNPVGDLTRRYEPEHQITEMTHDHNHQLVSQTHPNGQMKTWKRGFFGNVEKHTQLSGEQIIYVLNFLNKVTHEFTQADNGDTSGSHGDNYDFEIFPSKVKIDKQRMGGKNDGYVIVDTMDVSERLIPKPGRNVFYQHKRKLLDTILDMVSNKYVKNGYDNEGQLASEGYYRGGSLFPYAVIAEARDELRRVVRCDNSFYADTGDYANLTYLCWHDLVGNIRNNHFEYRPLAYIENGPKSLIYRTYWNTFDAVNRVITNNGVLALDQSTGKRYIGITYEQGSIYGYTCNKRTAEVRYAEYQLQSANITVDLDGVLSHAEITVNGKKIGAISRDVMPGVDVGMRVVKRNLIALPGKEDDDVPPLPIVENLTLWWNRNGLVFHSELTSTALYFFDTKTYSNTTFYTFITSTNEVDAVKSEIKDINDKVKQHDYRVMYYGMEEPLPGYAYSGDKSHPNVASAQLYDWGGLPNARINAEEDNPRQKKNPWPVYFNGQPNGKVLSKQSVSENTRDNSNILYQSERYLLPSKNKAIEETHYYQSLTNGPLGVALLKIDGFDLVKASLLRQMGERNDSFYPRVEVEAEFPSLVRPITSPIYMRGTKRSRSLDIETSLFDSISPQMYFVEEGDTFVSIAKNIFGTEEAAKNIMDHNAYLATQRLRVGTPLLFPEFINNKLNAETSRPYAKFIDIIKGSLAPYFPIPKQKQKSEDFLKIVIKIIVVAVALVITHGVILPHVLAFLGGAAAVGTIGASVVEGVLAGLADAAAQGLLKLGGIQDKFSLKEVLSTAITAGFAHGPMEEFAKASGAEATAQAMLKIGAATASAQLVMLETGVINKFDLQAVVTQMAAAYTGRVLGNGTEALQNTDEIAKSFMRNAGNTLVQAAISEAGGRPVTAQELVANTLGGMASDAASGNQGKSYKQYRDEKLDKLAQTMSQGRTPAIKQNIANTIKNKNQHNADDLLKKMDNLKLDKKSLEKTLRESERIAPSAATKLINKAQQAAAKPGEEYSFLNSATTMEKAAVIGTVAIMMPGIAVSALNTVATAMTLGPIVETNMLSGALAEAAISQAGRAIVKTATNFGTRVASSAAALGKMGLFKGRSVVVGTENTLYHTVTSVRGGQGVLDGINPEFFNPNSRFGEAFYLSEVPDTTLTELAHHNAIGVDTIRFNFNNKAANILDLNNPKIARQWGYSGGNDYDITQGIAERARQSGFDVIRYPSERGLGANLAVFNNFERLLTPQMIVPVPEELSPQLFDYSLR